MGDSSKVENQSSQQSGENQKPLKVAVIMLLLGLFAPYIVVYQSNATNAFYLLIQSLLWMYSASSPIYPGQNFMMIPLSVLLITFPFVLLRLVPVSQMYRYYLGKTTRRRTIVSLFVGDGISLFYALSAVFLVFHGIYLIPVTAQIIFGALMLWKSPYQEPRTPWDSVLEEKLWWDKDERSPQSKPKDEDELR